MAKRTTLKDIADEVSLSTSAVSLVLNGRPIKISEEKRIQILEAAKRLDYQTNRTPPARPPRSRKIGIITPNVTNGFFSEALDGMEQRVALAGYTVLLGQSYNRSEAEHDVLRRLLDNHVDGLIVSTPDDSLFDGLDVPVVLFNSEHPTLNYSQVAYNECKGAFLATKHLLGLGHRKIACLTGDSERRANGRLDSPRVDGYFWAYADSGLTAPEDSVFFGDYLEAQSGYDRLDQIVEGGFKALFCCNDLMAYGIYRRAAELKVRIPRDLSIVGFDDLSYSSLLTPMLTTIHQSGARIGREAAERLLHELDDPGAPHQSIRFEPSLIVRDSTCPPPSAG
jgi:LacI family transcriptional regulator